MTKDFICAPIWYSEFLTSHCCGTGTGPDGSALIKSKGSESGWNDDDPEFSWIFGREAPTLWNRTIQMGICCHRVLEIDLHYMAFESDTFDGEFTIELEDGDGLRTIYDAGTVTIPDEGGTITTTVSVEMQPRACGIVLTITGEITDVENAGGEPNEGTWWIDDIRIDPAP